jgi:hypothetical protein
MSKETLRESLNTYYNNDTLLEQEQEIESLRKQVTLLREGFEKIKCLYLTSKVPFYVATIADEALASTEPKEGGK